MPKTCIRIYLFVSFNSVVVTLAIRVNLHNRVLRNEQQNSFVSSIFPKKYHLSYARDSYYTPPSVSTCGFIVQTVCIGTRPTVYGGACYGMKVKNRLGPRRKKTKISTPYLLVQPAVRRRSSDGRSHSFRRGAIINISLNNNGRPYRKISFHYTLLAATAVPTHIADRKVVFLYEIYGRGAYG